MVSLYNSLWHELSKAEIADPDLVLLACQEHVLSLKVSVEDTLAVKGV